MFARDFPGDPVAKLPTQGAQVQSLVRELDPTMPRLKIPTCRNQDPVWSNKLIKLYKKRMFIILLFEISKD